MSVKDPRTKGSSQQKKLLAKNRRDMGIPRTSDEYPLLSSPNQNEQGGKRGRTASDQDNDVQTKSTNTSKRSKSVQRRSRTNINSPTVAASTISESNESNERTSVVNDNSQYDFTASTARKDNPNLDKEVKFDITNNAVVFATNRNLPPLKFACEPKVTDQKTGANIIKELFDYIKNDFKRIYPKHNDVIGFESWFTDTKGDIGGITHDIELFTFLCNPEHVPQKLANTQVSPILPKHLPSQRSIIMKGVPNTVNIEELKAEISSRYKSVYATEELMGTNNGKSRHVRVDVMDSYEYKQLLDSGVLCVEGRCLHIYEYLAPPKILFCSKCNNPGHHRRLCKLPYERCKRCGESKTNGEHVECPIKCHNCSDNHMSTDFKCPAVLRYRRELIQHLQLHPELLPNDVQVFVPLHLRQQGVKTLRNRQLYTQQPTNNNANQRSNEKNDQWPFLPTAARNTIFPTNPTDVGRVTTSNDIQLHISRIEKECEQAKNEYERKNLEIKNKMNSCMMYFQSLLATITTIIQRQNDIVTALKISINDCLQFNKITNQCIISMLAKPHDSQLNAEIINQLTRIPIEERQIATDNLFSAYSPLIQELTVKVMEVSSHLLHQNEQ